MEGLRDLYSVKEGHLRIDHSLRRGQTLSDARYVIVNPHDPSGEGNLLGLNTLPDEVTRVLSDAYDRDLLADYCRQGADAGINDLRRAILEACPGGLSLSTETNRGVINSNGIGPNAFPNIFTPETRQLLEPKLEQIHAALLEDTDRVLAAVSAGTRILCMHSMDPYGFIPGERPELSPQTMRAHVQAQGWEASRKIRRKEDFITGKKNGPNLADSEMYALMQELFGVNGFPWAVNDPYDTDGGHPDGKWLVQFPGLVSAIDLTKTRLCEGDAETFDSRKPKVDPAKIAIMAELHRIAINHITSTT